MRPRDCSVPKPAPGGDAPKGLLGFEPVIILPEALAAIRRHHRIAQAEAIPGLRALQPKAGAQIEANALRLAHRVHATPPEALAAEPFFRHNAPSTPECGSRIYKRT